MDKFFVKLSLKQLLRTPIKTALFFLLIMAVSLLLVFSGAVISQASESIAAAESEFVTLCTVEQPRDSGETRPLWNTCREGYADGSIEMLDIGVYRELLGPEVLDFEGAGYVRGPETRPYYLAHLPDYVKSFWHSSGTVMVAEFTVLEQTDEVRFRVRVEDLLYKSGTGTMYNGSIDDLISGGEIQICTHNQQVRQDLKPGRRYIGTVGFDQYSEEGGWDAESMVLYAGPFTTQVDADTHLGVGGGPIPEADNLYYEDGAWHYIEAGWTISPKFSRLCYADEVTEGFYNEGGRGEIWRQWAEGMERHEKSEAVFAVIPTDSMELLPSFHDGSALMKQGRAISEEEFDKGGRVCLVSNGFLARNLLEIGDRIPLSLVCSMYGDVLLGTDGNNVFAGMYSPLNADGRLYEPFWEAEYEIVGTYDMPFNEGFKYIVDTGREIKGDSIIIPMKSVEASDRNNIAYYAPMNADTTSFIIPNGTIEEFDRKLHEAVPEAAGLIIIYDDSGYGKVKESLDNARLSGMMLFIAALLAALAVIALLLYFFVVKEKKRTAIERSLGMTKNQCRVSLAAGIVMAALLASAVGSAGGALLMESVDLTAQDQHEDLDSEYSLDYSMWANTGDAVETEHEASTPWAVYAAVPLAVTALTAVLAVAMVDRNLQIEPIYLLSSKGE